MNPDRPVSPAALLDGSRTPGVYRVLDDPATIRTALLQAGWRTGVLPGVADPAGFNAAVAAALELPGHVGANLDALWDCLTDLTEPTALVLTDWTHLARARPERWSAILAVLTERTEQPPAFAVLLA